MKGEDVIVVGAGLIGCLLALRLRQAGLRVLVLDRGPACGEASTAAAGMLAPQAESEHDGPLFAFGVRARRLHAELSAELGDATGVDVAYCRRGLLFVAEAHEAPALAARCAWQARAGQAAAVIDAPRAYFPALAGDLVAAWMPDEASLDPRKLARAVLAACARAGVVVRPHAEVGALLAHGEKIRGEKISGVEVRGESVAAGAVVVAAGAWSSRLAVKNDARTTPSPLGADAIAPVRGVLTARQAGALAPAPIVFSHQGYLVPRDDGRVVVGTTVEQAGFDKQISAAALEQIDAALRRMAPALAEAPRVERWAGLRPAARDGLPKMGESAVRGLYYATGHYRNGILHAPLCAALMATLITTGRRDPLLEAFSVL